MAAAWPWTAWVWWCFAAAVAAGAVVLLAWALLADRARGRRRCPRCWYDVSGTPGLRCPECGHEARRERSFRRTRRHFRPAALAIAVLAGASVMAAIPKAKRDGWIAMVPTRVLIALYSDRHNPIGRALVVRIRGDELSPGDWDALFGRIVRGDRKARPGSEVWEDKYFNLTDSLPIWSRANPDHPVFTEWKRLYGIRPQYSLTTRATWPEGVPLYVHATYKTWWMTAGAFAMAVRPREIRDDPVSLFGGTANRRGMEFPEFTEPGPVALSFDVALYQRRYDQEDRWLEIGTDVLEVSCRIEGRLEDAMTPVVSSSIDDAIRVCEAHIFSVRWNPAPILEFVSYGTTIPDCDGIAFGADVQLLLGGDVVAETVYWWKGGNEQRYFDLGKPLEGDLERVIDAKPSDSWTLRLRSNPELALRVIDADRYWQGEVTIPVTMHTGLMSGSK